MIFFCVGQPFRPSIDLSLIASAAAQAIGQASAGQNLLETVTGSFESSASLVSINGVDTQVNQQEQITQAQVVNKPSGSTSTINEAQVGQDSLAVDSLEATMGGSESASVQNAAQTSASGNGSIGDAGSSVNIVQKNKNEWKFKFECIYFDKEIKLVIVEKLSLNIVKRSNLIIN